MRNGDPALTSLTISLYTISNDQWRGWTLAALRHGEEGAGMGEEPMNQYLPESPDTMVIVDDDQVNRGILENMFRGSYTIELAENGRIGLERILANRQRVCAVLLDVIMPEMDGIQVLRRLYREGLTEQFPVFLITVDDSDSIMREAYGMGVMDVISKPVVPYMVRRRVNSVVELFQARRRLGGVVVRQHSELLRQAEQIIALNMGMIGALSTAIEFRSGESGEHVRRIYAITSLLLRKTPLGLGLTQEEIEHVALASMMHDVGKIAIPDAILNKPGRLTPEEFEVMKTHTTQGARLLERIPQMRAHEAYRYAYDIARHHHERWDGGGYPDGLKGDEISIWSQVVSLADVYDALVSKRVYKPAFTWDQAVEMITSGACGVFNPELIRYFLPVEGEIRRLYQQPKEETIEWTSSADNS